MSGVELTKVRALREGVTCEITFTGPADAFRGEMIRALDEAAKTARRAIDQRYGIDDR